MSVSGSSADETDAMKVYLKNVVVNMLCEKDDAVKVWAQLCKQTYCNQLRVLDLR